MSVQKDLSLNLPETPKEPSAVYSHSRINTFENCPQQYKFRYIDKIKRDFESIEAFMGKRFHEVMENLYENLSYKVATLEELFAYYDAQWEKEFHPAVEVIKKDRTVEDYKALGRKCIENYYKKYYPFDQSVTLGIEKRIQVALDEDEKYRMMGFVDRIAQAPDGVYEIHDYKTSGSLPYQKKIEEDRQLALYQLAIQELWEDVKEVRLIWHYVAFSKEFISTRTQKDLEVLRDDYRNLIDRIEATEEFIPKESRLCDWCAFQDICPAKKHLFQKESPELKKGSEYVDQLTELALEKKELQAKIQEIDKKAKALTDEVGELAQAENLSILSGSTHALKITERQSVHLPKKGTPERDALVKKIQEIGKWEDVVGLDTHTLEKIIKEKQWPAETLDQIQKFFEVENRNTFTLSKLDKS